MLPLGDLSTHQMRKLADIAEKYVGNTVRTTVEQNFVLRWVNEGDLPELYNELNAIELATPGAGSIIDITACPGTDTCKLGIASSRGLAGELLQMLTPKQLELDKAVQNKILFYCSTYCISNILLSNICKFSHLMGR
jgi:sulfite reductase (ferredoxin)